MSAALDKILHVEDEVDIQEIAKMALEAVGGLNVRTCSDGEEALLVAPEFQPDLFLLDVMMPGMDGPETFQALQKLSGFENTPVIFMTAKVMEAEVARFKEIGALGVIAKPFDPMTLSDQIKALWDDRTA
ncbi:MAG: response regulator [Rhodospirillaceae bacterium]|nr:response regulator [Rhodospirillaceae bacterium]MBT5245339.1 response regulator [Rhodospirillaceae bacterium]MBT5562333.1 response regulator [Rhodospirillaceae bacterium]MBT6242676.1 response regulator [Rhodospirillaceae bacterium]MBT7138273.1 response regulator [Rhodospirillaceae bacterium]